MEDIFLIDEDFDELQENDLLVDIELFEEA
jgi:hypothetical protein